MQATLNTASIIALLIGTILPLAVGLVTKQSLNPGLKAVVLAFLAAVTAILSQWLNAVNDGTHFAWQSAVLSASVTYVIAELSYFKVWKPSGAAAVVATTLVKDTPSDNLGPAVFAPEDPPTA